MPVEMLNLVSLVFNHAFVGYLESSLLNHIVGFGGLGVCGRVLTSLSPVAGQVFALTPNQ